jgi:hypothetical protein
MCTLAMKLRRLIACLVLPLMLAACAAPIVSGTSREADVYASMGQPDERYDNPDGSRVLMYPGGPLGVQSWRVRIAPDGYVESVEELINDVHFARIQPGMTREQVRRELGRHGEASSFPNLQEDVWSWRYLEFGQRRMFFNVHFDPKGLVKYTSRTEEQRPSLPGFFGRF